MVKLSITKSIRVIVICVSLFGLFFYGHESYEKLKITPEVLVNEKYISSRTVPFPAVTMCIPLTMKSEILNISKICEKKRKNESLSQQEEMILEATANFCIEDCYYYKMLDKTSPINDIDEASILSQVSPDFNDILLECVVDSYAGCEQLFIRSLTDYGYCFSFNMLGYHSIFNDGIDTDFDVYKRKKITKTWNWDAKVEHYDDENKPEPTKWSLEGGYETDDHLVQPMRALRRSSLYTEILINSNDSANICKKSYNMLKIFLHLPNEVPNMMHNINYYSLKTIFSMELSAEIKKHDETLKNFDVDQRGCYFDGDMSLKFYKSYTKLNCEYECLVNFTLKSCGCVKFSMPRANDTKVCNFYTIECVERVALLWPTNYYKDPVMQEKFPDLPCACMPTCTQINYFINKNLVYEARKPPSDKKIHITVSIMFENSQIQQRTNYVTYKVHNFIADIGGLLGLFLGFSLLSIFESIIDVTSYIVDKIKKLKSREVTSHSTVEVQSTQDIGTSGADFIHTQNSDEVYTISSQSESSLVVEELE